jgi:hypothetical protein
VINAVDPHSIANEVRLSRTVRKGASALLVEGSKDMRLLRNHINEVVCDVVGTNGKTNALGGLNLLRNSHEAGVLVILDSDFSQIHGQQILDPDVIVTDLHDIEAMMLASPASAKLMIEYDLEVETFGPNIGELLAQAGCPLGYLRLVSQMNNLRLKFTDIDFRPFVELGPPVRIDEQKLIAEVLAKNPRCNRTAAAITQMMNQVKNAAHDPWHLSCGHDMTSILARLLSSKSNREVVSFTVERQLRLAYERQHFEATRLYGEIRAWEERNAPFVVLS